MKIADIIYDVTLTFSDRLAPDKGYLISEYNSLMRTLFLMLPKGDGVLKAVPQNGVIATDLLPEQVKRVYSAGNELLRASDSLRELLPSGRLYTPHRGEICVTVATECSIYYVSLPDTVDETTLGTAELPIDACYAPLVRAYLWQRAYIYIGDFESADAYAEEYNRLLEIYRRENGVAE